MKGGKRRGAGRKPKAEELREIEMIDERVSPEDWMEVFMAIMDKAKQGDEKCAKFVFDRRWGAAKQALHHTGKVELSPPSWLDGSKMD